MSFEVVLRNDIRRRIGSGEYRQNFKDRPHISKGKIDEYLNVAYPKVGDFAAVHYTDEVSSQRYIAAMNLTYDLLVSIFDVNTRTLIVYRTFRLTDRELAGMGRFATTLRSSKPNLEGRIIGLQNSEDSNSAIGAVADMMIAKKIDLVEVDLFGANIRHIAIDSKLGTSYNVLLDDRLYRPGELVNNITMENFEASMKELAPAEKPAATHVR